MTLTKWNPAREVTRWDRGIPAFRGVQSLRQEFDRIFDEFFRGDILATDPLFNNNWMPAVDIVEGKDSYVLKAELPGFEKEDVAVTLENNILTVRGEKKEEKDRNDASVHRSERRFGAFERSFTVPGTVKADAIDAQFRNGLLILTLPKADEARPKPVPITVR